VSGYKRPSKKINKHSLEGAKGLAKRELEFPHGGDSEQKGLNKTK